MDICIFENEIENMLNAEAHRVFDILWDMTKKHKKTTKSFADLVYDTIDGNYRCYFFEILHQINKLIPLEWCVNPENGDVFILENEYIKQRELKQQEIFEKKEKINKSIVNDVTNFIINTFENDKLENHSIMYFFSHYYDKYGKLDYDYEQVTFLIKKIINNIGNHYKILKLDPLSLEPKE